MFVASRNLTVGIAMTFFSGILTGQCHCMSQHLTRVAATLIPFQGDFETEQMRERGAVRPVDSLVVFDFTCPHWRSLLAHAISTPLSSLNGLCCHCTSAMCLYTIALGRRLPLTQPRKMGSYPVSSLPYRVAWLWQCLSPTPTFPLSLVWVSPQVLS